VVSYTRSSIVIVVSYTRALITIHARMLMIPNLSSCFQTYCHTFKHIEDIASEFTRPKVEKEVHKGVSPCRLDRTLQLSKRQNAETVSQNAETASQNAETASQNAETASQNAETASQTPSRTSFPILGRVNSDAYWLYPGSKRTEIPTMIDPVALG
jgi:hypothetical protein